MSNDQNQRIKASHHTWWIGGIIGFIYALSESDSKDIGLLIFAWVSNGIGWGWLVGFLIDKIIDFLMVKPANPDVTKTTANSNISATSAQSVSKQINLDENDYFKNGQTKVLHKDYKGAVADYTRAVDINPIFSSAYYCRGNVKCCLKDFSGGISDYTKAIEFDPKDANTFFMRAIAKSSLNDYSGIVDDLSRAIEIEPENVTFYQLRGQANIQVEDFIGARQDYTKALALDPENAISYYNRGIARLLSGSEFSAYSDLKRAGELGYSQAYYVIKEAGLS